MTKEEVLDQHIKELISENPGIYQPFGEIKASKEYQMQLKAMEQYANQRSEEFRKENEELKLRIRTLEQNIDDLKNPF